MLIVLSIFCAILAGLVACVAFLRKKSEKKHVEMISALQNKVTALEAALGNAVTKGVFEAELTALRVSIGSLVIAETAQRYSELERTATDALFIRGRAIEARLHSGRNGNGHENRNGHKKPEPTAQLDASQISAEMVQARQKREKCKVGSKDHETQDYIVQRLKVDLALAVSGGELTVEVLAADIALTRWEREHSQKGSGEWAGHNSRLQDLKAQLANFSNSAAASAANN